MHLVISSPSTWNSFQSFLNHILTVLGNIGHLFLQGTSVGCVWCFLMKRFRSCIFWQKYHRSDFSPSLHHSRFYQFRSSKKQMQVELNTRDSLGEMPVKNKGKEAGVGREGLLTKTWD